jgi:hypothetical protein
MCEGKERYLAGLNNKILGQAVEDLLCSFLSSDILVIGRSSCLSI